MVVEGLPEIWWKWHTCTEHEIVKVVDDARYRGLALEIGRLERRKVVVGVSRIENRDEIAKSFSACCLI